MEYFAVGSDLYIGANATALTPGAWTSIGCVVDVTPNTIAASFNEVRPCLNATNRTIKKRPSTIDYGSIGVTFRFDATQYAAIKTQLEARTTKAVAIVLGDTTKAAIATCYVENLQVQQLSEDGEVTCTASFLITSDYSIVASSTVVGS